MTNKGYCFFKLAVLGLAVSVWAGTAWGQDRESGRRHPDYNLLMGRDAKDVASPDSPLNPNFIMGPAADRTSVTQSWRSQHISERVVGLAVADLDGDGLNEVVYATTKSVYVARVEGAALKNLASHRVSLNDRLISLDLFDLNGDGRQEIVVSAQRNDLAPSGLVLQYSPGDGELQTVAENINWYMRVVNLAEGPRLLGQRGSTKMRQAYEGNIQYLAFNGKIMSGSGAVKLPKKVDLYGFTQGLAGSPPQAITAAIKFPEEHLWLYGLNDNGKIWETTEEYGGTVNHIKTKTGQGSYSNAYLSSRILLVDIDRDGQNEVVVAQNDRGGIAFMGNLRGFSGGSIVAFKLRNFTLSEYFRTNRLQGAAVDYQVADFNNNGTPDLVAAVVVEAGNGLFEEARSAIIAYELGSPSAQPAARPKSGGPRKK